MTVKEKIQEFEALEAKIRELSKGTTDMTTATAALDNCRQRMTKIQEGKSKKRMAIVWVIVGLVALLVEVMLLTETFIRGYDEFNIFDIVIIALPFLIALGCYADVDEAKKAGTESAVAAQIKALEAKLESGAERAAQLRAAKEAMRYQGRNWDLTTFRATPETVCEMELDAVNLLYTVKYAEGDDEIIKNWMCRCRMEHITAQLKQKEDIIQALDAGYEEMQKSDSWYLSVMRVMMLTMDVALLSTCLGGENVMSFDEMCEKCAIREAQTDEEKIFIKNASTATDKMCASMYTTIGTNIRNSIT